MRLYNNCDSIFREGKMDKKWKEFAAANGLACEKNQCYGTLYGYQVSITMEVNSGLVYRVGVCDYERSGHFGKSGGGILSASCRGCGRSERSVV